MKRSVLFFCGILFIVPVAYGELSAVNFPETITDLSFGNRVANLTDGYTPFLSEKTYRELDIVPGEEIYTDHTLAVMENEFNQREQDNISKYPDDEKTPSSRSSPSKAIYYFGRTIGGGAVIENNFITGGSCYPADHDRWYKNKIFTTGRFETQSPAFEKGMITIFRKEGTTCGKIPNDPGGYTCYGIASNIHHISPEVLRKYTIADAEDFYYKKYWQSYKIYNLPDVISTDVFLAGVASGMGSALSQFRKFLGLKSKTSAPDQEMINAVKAYKGDIHNDWINLRDKYLEKVAREHYNNYITYKHAIEIKRKNGCHVRPVKPLYRY